jgi:hypothetical protein
MISHEHKCIFIHISKCAGSSIEHGFGINLNDNTENNNKNLFGWNSKHEIFLQHATPQQLLDNKFITQEIWDTYYKFIIVRNPYSRAKSDFLWLEGDSGIKDSFSNFLLSKGKFKNILTVKDYRNYRGDHLNTQYDYFFINGNEIAYNRVLRFENLETDLKSLCEDLELKNHFFNKKINVAKKTKKHYSYFYNKSKIKLLSLVFKNDLEFLNYSFEDKRNLIQKLINIKP